MRPSTKNLTKSDFPYSSWNLAPPVPLLVLLPPAAVAAHTDTSAARALWPALPSGSAGAPEQAAGLASGLALALAPTPGPAAAPQPPPSAPLPGPLLLSWWLHPQDEVLPPRGAQTRHSRGLHLQDEDPDPRGAQTRHSRGLHLQDEDRDSQRLHLQDEDHDPHLAQRSRRLHLQDGTQSPRGAQTRHSRTLCLRRSPSQPPAAWFLPAWPPQPRATRPPCFAPSS